MLTAALTGVCRCRNPDACPGNSSNSCSQGYTSNLCGECEAYWGSPRQFVCRECGKSATILTLYVLAAVVLLFYTKILCHFTLSSSNTPTGLGPFTPPVQGPVEETVQQHPHHPQHLQRQPTRAAACVTDIAHVFMFYLQCLWILSSLNARFPVSLSAPFHALEWLFSSSSPRALGIDCILRDRSHMPVPVQEFLLSMLMPLAIMLVLLAFETLAGFCKPYLSRCSARFGYSKTNVKAQFHKLIATGIIVMSTFLPQLLRAVFGLFACVPLDAPVAAPYEANAVGTFWVRHMSQQCWQGFHKGLALGAGIPLVLLLCVVWPGSVLVFMPRHRDGSLYSNELRHYSFLYALYRPAAAWWEVVVIVQLALLVAISVFAVNLGTYFGCVVLIAAFFLVFLLLGWLRPYESRITCAVAIRGALCVFLACFSTLVFMPAGSVSGQVESGGAYEHYAVAVGVVVLCMNVAYVVWVGWHVVRVVGWKRMGHKLKSVAGKVMRVNSSRSAQSGAVPAGRAGKSSDVV